MNTLLIALILAIPSPVKLDIKIEKPKLQMPIFRPSGVKEPYIIMPEFFPFPEHLKQEPKYIRYKLK